MLKLIIFLLFFQLFISCNNKRKEGKRETKTINNTAVNTIKEPFFPVTSYLKGQINNIQKGGVNPIKYVSIKNRTDSSWVKMEDLGKEVSSFLEDIIDTANLAHLFAEKKFLDQTINAYTFTYDPIGRLPDSFRLQHWDVYVDPETNYVKRIYLIKKINDNKILQLTWQSDKWCKLVTISTDKDGKSTVEKDILIKWDF